MTPTSLLPKIADHAGIEYGALCEMILESATLHANVAGKKPESERRRSGVAFTPLAEASSDARLVRKAI
jgi:D-alanine-D-alanine ligase